MSTALATQQNRSSFIQYWQTGPLHNQGEKRRSKHVICTTATFSYIKTSRRAFLNRHEVNLFGQNKRKHSELCAAVQWRGGQTSSFTCVYTYQRLLQQDTGLLLVLHWGSHFCALEGHFFHLALTQIFAAALARTMAAARFCQLHIAADHRDMQRPWINYFMGNSTTAAETFSTGKPTVESWYCCIPNGKIARAVCHLCFTISVQIKSSGNSCKIPMVVSPSYLWLPSLLSWCEQAFGLRRSIFTGGWPESIWQILTRTEEKYVGRLRT